MMTPVFVTWLMKDRTSLWPRLGRRLARSVCWSWHGESGQRPTALSPSPGCILNDLSTAKLANLVCGGRLSHTESRRRQDCSTRGPVGAGLLHTGSRRRIDLSTRTCGPDEGWTRLHMVPTELDSSAYGPDGGWTHRYMTPTEAGLSTVYVWSQRRLDSTVYVWSRRRLDWSTYDPDGGWTRRHMILTEAGLAYNYIWSRQKLHSSTYDRDVACTSPVLHLTSQIVTPWMRSDEF